MAMVNNYHVLKNSPENIVYSDIKTLRNENHFFDVTLACDDDTIIQAHKLILSAHSNIFKKILIQTQNTSPWIYMRGVEFQQLSAILDFMYTGEAKVEQRGLHQFLQAAKDLEIKGLVQTEQATENELIENDGYNLKEETDINGEDDIEDILVEDEVLYENPKNLVAEVSEDEDTSTKDVREVVISSDSATEHPIEDISSNIIRPEEIKNDHEHSKDFNADEIDINSETLLTNLKCLKLKIK